MRTVDRLHDIDVALSELEASIIAGAQTAAAASERLRDIADLDLERAGPFAERVKALTNGDVEALEKASTDTEKARGRLAIEMEIAAGLETPTEYQTGPSRAAG
jgi:hypothetical protein